jgi:hypothetical protein
VPMCSCWKDGVMQKDRPTCSVWSSSGTK